MNPRIILDTNVLISALMKDDGDVAKVYHYTLKYADLLLSDEIELEYGQTLFKQKFRKYFPEKKVFETLALISVVAHRIKTSTKITDCRDADDNKFLELALDSRADYIISGDPDLLDMNPFRGIKILNPQQFLKLHKL